MKLTQPTKTACNMNASFRLAQCHAKMKCFSEAVAALDRSVETLEANPAVEPRCSIRLEKIHPPLVLLNLNVILMQVESAALQAAEGVRGEDEDEEGPRAEGCERGTAAG